MSKNITETTFKHKKIINLVENEMNFQNDKLIADTFNKYFCIIVKKTICSIRPKRSIFKFMSWYGKSFHRKI